MFDFVHLKRERERERVGEREMRKFEKDGIEKVVEAGLAQTKN